MKLQEYIVKGGRRLRLGYTTGSCAAAAAKASAAMLLSGEILSAVELSTPKGLRLILDLEDITINGDSAACAVRKDGGDDPDVTDGLLVYAKTKRLMAGIHVTGGPGIGKITRKGLPCPVGEYAINPEPMAQIRKALEEVIERAGYRGGLDVTLWVPEGERIARHTFNQRLGIVGGISILGTTGIVEPMSEKALIDAIKAELTVIKSRGDDKLLLTPGNYGAHFIRNTLGLALKDAVQCSNFIGEILDYAAYLGFHRVLLVGHGGKLVKIAGGIMQTHSSQADCRMEILAAYSGISGADSSQQARLLQCVTVEEANACLNQWGLLQEVWKQVSRRISFHLNERTKDQLAAEHIVFTEKDGVLCASGKAYELAAAWKENLC